MAINFQNQNSLDTGANSDLQVDVILQEALDTFQKILVGLIQFTAILVVKQ